jgi:hypothetical protein
MRIGPLLCMNYDGASDDVLNCLLSKVIVGQIPKGWEFVDTDVKPILLCRGNVVEMRFVFVILRLP